MGIEQLEPFIGEWEMEAVFPGRAPLAGGARCTFEWILGGRFLSQRAGAPDPAPDALMLISAREEGFTQHYFDDRGVVRVYEMSFDGGRWELLRTKPDFTPLDFCQRYVGEFSDDGGRIEGGWESSSIDGGDWELDFRLNYTKVA